MALPTMPKVAKSKIGAFSSMLTRDHVGTFHADAVLHGARDASGDVEFWPHCFAGLPDLPLEIDPAGLYDRPGGAYLGTEDCGEIPDELEVFGAFHATSAGDDEIGKC